MQDAEAYKEQRINEAKWTGGAFRGHIRGYVKYPLDHEKAYVLYETMEEVLPDLKVIITGGNGARTLLPLETIFGYSGSTQTGGGNRKRKDRKKES